MCDMGRGAEPGAPVTGSIGTRHPPGLTRKDSTLSDCCCSVTCTAVLDFSLSASTKLLEAHIEAVAEVIDVRQDPTSFTCASVSSRLCTALATPPRSVK